MFTAVFKEKKSGIDRAERSKARGAKPRNCLALALRHIFILSRFILYKLYSDHLSLLVQDDTFQ